MTIALAVLVSALGLALYRAIALRVGLVDKPNDRSQHEVPTVVGAGAPIALATLLAVLCIKESVFLGSYIFMGCCLVISAIGLADDRFHLPSSARLLAYLSISGLVVLVEFPGINMGLLALAVLALVWNVNLVNFMDGADGYAATQTLAVCGGFAILTTVAGAPEIGLLCLVLGGALVPFLFRNWPPASMFMGDAGAVFIGFYLGVMGLLAASFDFRLGLAWLILMMPFVLDATGTLLIRLVQGHLPHVAHQDHAYQRFLQRSGSVPLLNIGLLMLQGVWQFPLASWVVLGSYSPLLPVILSPIPSLLILVYLRRRP